MLSTLPYERNYLFIAVNFCWCYFSTFFFVSVLFFWATFSCFFFFFVSVFSFPLFTLAKLQHQIQLFMQQWKYIIPSFFLLVPLPGFRMCCVRTSRAPLRRWTSIQWWITFIPSEKESNTRNDKVLTKYLITSFFSALEDWNVYVPWRRVLINSFFSFSPASNNEL